MTLTLRAKDWFHPDGFPLAVERRDPQEPFGLHGHDFSEVVVVTGGPGFGFMATALFMQLVAYLSRAYGRSRSPDSQALLRIASAIAHLETRYAEEIELDDLADMAHMSKRSFLRTFQAATGQPPIAY